MKQKNRPIKAYNMAILDDESAEINMYGEVIATTPTDWEGNPIAGTYIAADEFLKDIENIKSKKNITVHINSGGGDLYAGLAIYNRLKMLRGHVTTVNDGMAASAASLIFQAGDTRKMNAGSNLMAHGVAGFMFGYYNAEDLKATLKEFEAHNKAIINVYAEAMGVSESEAKKFVKGETWLTGKEAVDIGLADEVVEVEDDIEDMKKGSFANKLLFKLANTAAVPPIADTSKQEEKEEMEIKNLEDLKTAYPEFVAQIERAAVDEVTKQAVDFERGRIKAIEEIENSITDKALVNEAKYGEHPMTAEQLALKAMQAQQKANAEMLNSLEKDAMASGASAVNADPDEEEKTEEEKEEEEAKNAFSYYAEVKNGGRK